MSYDIGVGDLLAMKDVAEGLMDASTGLSAEQALVLLDAAQAAYKALGDAIAFLQSRAISQLEDNPVLIGRTAWSKVPAFKRRPNQAAIRQLVTDEAHARALNKETGEIDPAIAAVAAIALMEGLYVSPSTVPKVGGVKALGAEMEDVMRDEHTGFELKKVEL